MKIRLTRVSEYYGYSIGLEIHPETDFEKDFLDRHDFPKMYNGTPVIKTVTTFKKFEPTAKGEESAP